MPTLEEFLVASRLLSPTQLAVAQRDAEIRHRRLAQTVIELGMVSDRHFAQWMAGATGFPLLDPIPDHAVADLRRRVPRAIAREYEVVPVALEGTDLTVAMVNPLDRDCLAVLATTTGMRVRPAIAMYRPLAELVARHYPEDDVEATILPPSAALAGYEAADQSPGSETRVFAPRPPARDADDTTNPVTPVRPVPEHVLERIEQKLGDLSGALVRLERRLDAIDEVISRVLSRERR